MTLAEGKVAALYIVFGLAAGFIAGVRLMIRSRAREN